MLLPINWMKKYLQLDMDIMELTDGVTQSGSHVESISDLANEIENVVVGKILKIEKHPNADKLSLVILDDGTGEIQVVTGAKNMKVGDLVALAKVGAKLPGGINIKETDLKGIISPGMLCSYEELGYSDSVVPKNSKDGILILEGDIKPGTHITDALMMDEPVVEFEITPNRPDCLSIVGMARETAATFDKKIVYPSVELNGEVEEISQYFDSVEIESDNCMRYVARVVKDVVIKDSPQWLQNLLMQAGMRPINNIVDITNYVMLELGQPIHAFDINTLKDRKIVVRQAVNGEKMTTLDKVDRELLESDLVITDGKVPVALAGVMGGLDSDIENHTSTILIESAAFDKDSVRRTSKRLGLRTEASQRFEKGITSDLCKFAADRVCKLIEETESGNVVKGSIDNYKVKPKLSTVEIDYKKINALLGTDISKEKCISYLEGLEFSVATEGDRLIISVPSNRMDVTIPEDIVEEVGRLYGFHNIAPKSLEGTLSRGIKSYQRTIEDRTKEIMVELGLFETTTYSFISPKAYEKIYQDIDNEKQVILRNPLGEDFSVMRTTLIPNIMEVLDKNYKFKADELKVFEIGNTFHKITDDELPKERKSLVMGMYGKYDFYDLKDMVLVALDQLGIKDVDMVANENNPTFHSGRCGDILVGGEKIGIMGEISYEVMENYHINEKIYICEIDMEMVTNLADDKRIYKKIIKYPSIKRDIAIVVDRDLETKTIEDAILSVGKGLIRKIRLFDIYTGEHVDADKKSLAYTIVYQSESGTLKDEEIALIQNDILTLLEESFDAELRR